ncbi:MAG: hypothetical protein ABII27_02305 [bacterium]
MSYLSIKSVYLKSSLISIVSVRYFLFVIIGSSIIGLIVGLFTTVVSKEVKVVAY